MEKPWVGCQGAGEADGASLGTGGVIRHAGDMGIRINTRRRVTGNSG